MDTRFLETFLMAVDNGSIAEAARRLNLTPAAVAKRIHILESEMGAVLFARSGRTIRPTEAAMAIVERARHVLGEVRDFTSIAATDRLTGELRVGAYQSALSGMLPDILALMKEKYPQIQVRLTRGISAELYRKVLDGDDLDAAIIAEPPFAIPKSCDWRLLREEPFIRLDRNLWPGRLVDSYLRQVGIRPREFFEIDGAEAIAVMVDRGLGVSLMPDWAPPWPEGLSLAKLPVPDASSFARRVGLVWARASLRLRLVHAFLEQAMAARAQGAARRGANSRGRVGR